jgi:hypothetical protein
MAEPSEAEPTAELLVVGYPDVDTANEALETLKRLDKDRPVAEGARRGGRREVGRR